MLRKYLKLYSTAVTRRRHKLTKQLTQVKSPIAKSKIDSELLQIEKDLQKSFKNSHYHMEQKAVEAIKSNPKYFFRMFKLNQKWKQRLILSSIQKVS